GQPLHERDDTDGIMKVMERIQKEDNIKGAVGRILKEIPSFKPGITETEARAIFFRLLHAHGGMIDTQKGFFRKSLGQIAGDLTRATTDVQYAGAPLQIRRD